MHKNTKLALNMAMLTVGMICLTYAAFPLYNLFCKVTGYGGTPQRVEERQTHVMGEKTMTVRFNADTESKLPWTFKPEQQHITLQTGEEKLAVYSAVNRSDAPITGVATFNVTPEKAAIYFNKIQCFCFEEQTLQPNESVKMPVSFYIDPAIETDPNTKEISTVTLSYTFFEKH